MRIISAGKIRSSVAELCLQANLVLRPDVLAALKSADKKETNERAKDILQAIVRNAGIARREKLAICQDTGMPCVFVELGNAVKIQGGLKNAINQGVESGYRKGFLRDSIIQDPLLRGKPGYLPPITHIDIVQGNKVRLAVLPKGFGCENKTQLKMFKPTAEIEEIKKFILEAVKNAGPDACPPYVVGVGIGGTADYACLLAKKALLNSINRQTGKWFDNLTIPRTSPSKVEGPANRQTYRLEKQLLSEINQLNIGPMGLGGKTTALAVNIATYPTHIAGLPVCVNISCHALRSAAKTI